MKLGKRVSGWWNSLMCFLFGHSLTTVCTRCGKFVDLKGKKKLTIEERLNNYFAKRSKLKEPEYKGSLKLVPGLHKYSINMRTNELSLVNYSEEIGPLTDKKGNKILDKRGNEKTGVTKRVAKYDPSMVYIDAMNDEVAIRKANEFFRTIKDGVKITQVTKCDECS